MQYYGWALRNRDALLPTRATIGAIRRDRGCGPRAAEGRLRIEFVLPDYYAKYPKPCMNGWGHQLMLIDPAGRVLPCHAAGVIPGLDFPSAREQPLRWIWEESPAFNRFRGEELDAGALPELRPPHAGFRRLPLPGVPADGDAAATDPVCTLAPRTRWWKKRLTQCQQRRGAQWVYRIDPV